MYPRIRNLVVGLVVSFVVVGLSAVEDWFERFDYSPDAISYLEISQAIRQGDWALALNPYWSIGYPAILAMTRWMFPSGPQGEWTAVHVVNLVIFLATSVSFLYFLKVALIFTARINSGTDADARSGSAFLLGIAIFSFWQLQINFVSRVSPDLLVIGVFFLVTATSLQFCMRPRRGTAVLLGLLMSFGYLCKAIFLPISCCVFLVVLIYGLARPRGDRWSAVSQLGWALPAIALLVAPYSVGISKESGTFTLGESGPLNYAWAVNGLPQFTHWQGGSLQLGTPIHPTHLLLRDPPVFTFAGPFHVTYPPWFNPFYWYEGYHRYFSIKNQVATLKYNIEVLLSFFVTGPHVVAKTLALGLLLAMGLLLLKHRLAWWTRVLSLWPLYLPSVAAIGIYLLVVIEERYVAGFLIVLFIAPLLPLFVPTQLISTKAGYVMVILVIVGSTLFVVKKQGEIFRHAVLLPPYTSNEEWRIGLYLAQAEVHPGDKVASVKVGNGSHCLWAYVAGVHVVAEIGNDAFDPENQEKDFALFVRSPDVQKTVFNLFKQAGAVVVVAFDVKETLQGPGWERVPGTQAWFHRLDGNTL
jgi:hypothetical protein